MASTGPSRIPASPAPQLPDALDPPAPANSNQTAAKPITVLIVVPTLDEGSAEYGAVELVRILKSAGHHAIVAARSGRLIGDVIKLGGEFVALDVASKNPFVMLRNAVTLMRIARRRDCDVIHALGRAGAWSAALAARRRGIAFVTGWTKGFSENNPLKRFYNGVMARGDRVIATCDDIAELVHERYGTPWQRLAVVPISIDFAAFDPAAVTWERVSAIRRAFGVEPETKVFMVTGRLVRRKGHHVVVEAIKALKDRGLTDFVCVFVGEDRGNTAYTGELWDLVVAHGLMDFVRMAAPVRDMPAAYAAASVVISAAVQLEGVQRALLEAQAMARPVIVSDLAAGPDVVLTAPAVPDNRATGIRCPAGDPEALAAAVFRLMSTPEQARAAMGRRGRAWVIDHFDASMAAGRMLALYRGLAGGQPKSRREPR
ncbi:glycosyltransferase [Undibacter mobilis]|uniref:Glycosyltransferase n=1 Tax=Undibacter mobilis TaxID=2292256 RepID=A0A371B992_9BRAD|nr:glycosyltransferase [Undibacter mobilis]RDV04114.1 glycosyltransferase [Undibacter mobilis]